MTVNVERKEKKKQQNKTKQNNDEKIEWRQKRELGWTERIIFVIIVVAFVAQKEKKLQPFSKSVRALSVEA